MPALAQVDFVHLHADDNIVVAARLLEPGEMISVEGCTVRVVEPIRMGHKVAIAPIAKGGRVLKYGQQIGVTTAAVEPGQAVHSHNLVNSAGERDFAPCSETPPDPAPITGRTFTGYRRANGKAGTRNYLAVISTVNCSASVSKYVAQRFDPSLLKDFPNIDGVIAFTHGSGCGIQYKGLAHEMLNRTLAGMARHPNIGGFLLIGLGCEQGAMGYLLESQRLVQINGHAGKRQGPPVLSMQDLGGTTKTVEEGVRQLAAMLPQANAVRREPIPASEIVLGTNCGGSDGNSGVTANPALGVASDMLVACGATSILAETPEIYGAEHLLTRRAKTPQVAQKLLDRIEWWKWYTGVFGADMDNNPSVGNKEGGLTTISEKSLGAVAKAGSTAMTEVYEYSEPVTAKGFVVMDTPGFDPASVTGIVAGGANLVVFTTGRGSCFGCKPAPSIKIATNTPMYERMIDDMDINAGVILQGATVRQVGEHIFEEILAVASGKKTKSETYNIGDEEFVPWLPGPML
jgi:altronate hydrolase